LLYEACQRQKQNSHPAPKADFRRAGPAAMNDPE